MWRLIYILFGSTWLLVLSRFFMFLHLLYADIFTKGLPTAAFVNFRSSLNVRSSPG
jgi:hypothetical protein